MIKINLLSDEDRKRIRAIVNFYNRPFSLRHPELKKQKCVYCKLKFTAEEMKTHTHTINKPSKTGSSLFKGKRRLPHYSKRRLLFVERVKQLMPLVEGLSDEEFKIKLREARIDASRQLRKEMKAASKQKRDQQKLSRKINRK